MGPFGDVVGRSAFNSCEDLVEICCLVVEILKKLKNAKNGEFELVFCRFCFISLVKPSKNVQRRFAFNCYEDLVKIVCLEREIW